MNKDKRSSSSPQRSQIEASNKLANKLKRENKKPTPNHYLRGILKQQKLKLKHKD